MAAFCQITWASNSLESRISFSLTAFGGLKIYKVSFLEFNTVQNWIFPLYNLEQERMSFIFEQK